MSASKLKLYNSLSKKVEEFKPIKKGVVSMYACGPTVYQSAHLGNMRTYIFEDLLRRVLEYDGYKVKHVMNITDFGHLTSDADSGEDKVEKAAKHQKKSAKDITKFYAKEFKLDLERLNVKLPTKFAWTSDYIKAQIDLIKRLEKSGFTYKTSDGLYFDTAKLKNYGRLGGVGEVSAVRIFNREKKDPADFALWKLSKPGEKREFEWDSPWGKGYPGWHIECSAISAKELGQPFDIHLGGEDHISVHHNNEIAQSEAAYGKPLANYWVHGAFMLMDKAKMAKSKGNFVTLSDLDVDPLAFRYLVVASHYRQKLNFSKTAVKNAQNSLNKLRALFAVKEKGGRICKMRLKRFDAAVNNDLSMPRAMEIVWELVKTDKKSLADKQATLLEFDKVLGLGLKDYKVLVPAEVKKLVAEREKARKSGDWAKADKLRKKIEGRGYTVTDTGKGSVAQVKT